MVKSIYGDIALRFKFFITSTIVDLTVLIGDDVDIVSA